MTFPQNKLFGERANFEGFYGLSPTVWASWGCLQMKIHCAHIGVIEHKPFSIRINGNIQGVNPTT